LQHHIEQLRETETDRRQLKIGKAQSKLGKVAQLRKRIIRLFHEGRVGAASRTVDEASKILEDEGLQERSSLSFEDASDLICSLNPPAEEYDELPPREEDLQVAQDNADLLPTLEITAELVRLILSKLPSG
jgi:hypothetical protein